MTYLSEGIKVGLLLSLLAGPILFTLLQTGIEKGFRAGLAVGSGIWISDVLFIVAVYYGLSYVKNFVSGQAFVLTLGIIGGLLLVIFGVGSLLQKAFAGHSPTGHFHRRQTLDGPVAQGLPNQYHQSIHLLFLDRHRRPRRG